MTDNPIEELASLDRLVHDPSRLAILTTLEACESADFTFLCSITGLTKGNLATHISKLEGAGLVSVHKAIFENKPNTSYQITESGRAAIAAHWERLDSLRRRAHKWLP